jgi:hypothetical protein
MKKLDAEKRKIIEGNIPEAVRAANAAKKQHLKEHGNLKDFEGWDAVYHRTMDKLCKADGVRV